MASSYPAGLDTLSKQNVDNPDVIDAVVAIQAALGGIVTGHKGEVNLPNVAASSMPARSNGYFLGFGGLTDSALAATGVGCFVPVPVAVGDVISAVTVPIGATAGATLTHQFAAIYSGIAVPALLAQSADNTAAAITASTPLVSTLAAPVTITSAMAPRGFIYAEIAITGTTIPTAVSIPTATAVYYQWFTNGPLFQSATAGSALAGTAAATCASPAAKATAPLVFLT